jgi:uncharacterized membrane protein (UPF0127 family)
VLNVGCNSLSRKESSEVVFVASDGSKRATFNLEVVDSEPLRQKGLMFRDSLPENGGMLFIFDESEQLSFWMKNTKIPLDMIFIGSDRTVQGILESVPPMNEEPRYIPNTQSRYVVELAAGSSSRAGIRVGDTVRW